MGTTDKTIHNFNCPKCGVEETITVVEKGSGWGASWMTPPQEKHFTIEWKRRTETAGEPDPVTIVCNACGTPGIDQAS